LVRPFETIFPITEYVKIVPNAEKSIKQTGRKMAEKHPFQTADKGTEHEKSKKHNI